MRDRTGWLCALLMIVLQTQQANGQDTSFTATSSVDEASLGRFIRILEDKTRTLTLDDVQAPETQHQFFSSDQDEPGFGFTSSVYWVKLTVTNGEDSPLEWFLEIAYPLIDFVELYIPDGHGGFSIRKTGDRLPFDTREINNRNFLFHLVEEPAGERTYYLRFDTESSMNIPLHFWSENALLEKVNTEQVLLGIFFGSVVIMIVYNLLLFIAFGDRSFLYYVLFITSWGFAQLAINGLAFQYVWSNWIWWANINLPVFIFAAIAPAVQFCRSLLDTKKTVPFWDAVLKYEAIFLTLGMIVSLVVDYAISIRVATASSILAVVTTGLASMKGAVQKQRAAIFFLSAWGLFMLGVVLFALKSFGVLPSTFVTNWGIQIGAFALLVLFSLAAQDHVNREKREKYLAQKAALGKEQKIVQMLKESERLLEEKVAERTNELEIKNVSLNKRTKELQELAEELDTLDKIVATINREIEFVDVIDALLVQGLKLFPKAEHAAALILDAGTGRYHAAASVGFEKKLLDGISMSRDEIRSTFLRMAEEVEEGIFVIRRNQNAAGAKGILDLTGSQSILSVTMNLQGQMAGYLLFDNTVSSDAFDQSDVHKMMRFRSHAISAFTKAKLRLDMKKANDEIVKAQGQLIVQEKMASLGQLTAGIAHEIKNPLNFVNNFAEGSIEIAEELGEALASCQDSLKKKEFKNLVELVKELKENSHDIYNNGKRADSIVRSMMDHARGSKGERRPVDLNALVEENINLAYHGYRAIDSSFNVTVERNFDTSISPIEMVQSDIGRVLLNILNNACYAVREKQKKEGDQYSPMLSVSTKSNDGEVEIRIRDNGPGIPQEILDRIFNPFFTTKPTGEGSTGLGLSISYDIIVQEHGGSIRVHSTLGEYAEFAITLPLKGVKK